MNASVETPIQQQASERYKSLIVLLTVLTTVLAAILAALQADASIRADVANRDSQFLAIQASGELQRAGLETTYEFNVFGDYLTHLQEATVLGLTALEQEQLGNKDAAQTARDLASISQARADMSGKFSIFYADPRYAPRNEGDLPRAEQYITDLSAKANEIVASQNDAADAYQIWNRKADSYITALTILAVAFFLFGLAQAVKNARLRLSFLSFGVVIILFSLFMTATTLIL
jgi:hypothetical protein